MTDEETEWIPSGRWHSIGCACNAILRNDVCFRPSRGKVPTSLMWQIRNEVTDEVISQGILNQRDMRYESLQWKRETRKK